MTTPPTAVAVFGWFWRVGGVLGMVLALPLALWYQDLFGRYAVEAALRLSTTALFSIYFSSSLLCLLFGNGILRGRNWARILALAYCLAATLVGAVVYKDHPFNWLNFLANLAFTVAMWFFLFRSRASVFFTGEVLQEEPKNE